MDLENNINAVTNETTSNISNQAATTQVTMDLNSGLKGNINNTANTTEIKNIQKPKKGKNILFLILGIILGIVLFIGYNVRTAYQYRKEIKDMVSYYQNLSNQGHENQMSGLYKFTSSAYSLTNSGTNIEYSTYRLEAIEGSNFDYESYLNGDDSSLLSWYANSREAKLKDNPWIEGLYDFRSFIYLDLSFSGSTLLDRDIVDKESKVSLGKLTVEELNKKYNYDTTHEIKELNIDKGDIKLSELKENDIYQYTITSGDYTTPKFINNLNQAVILYKKSNFFDSDSLKYDSEIIFAGDSVGGGFGFSTSENTYNIYYKMATTEEVLKEIGDDDIIYLSKYNIGEQISFWGEEIQQEGGGTLRVGSLGDYMYNDTESTLTVKILDESFGDMRERDVVEIEPGEIYKRYRAADAFIMSNEKIDKEVSDNDFKINTSGDETQNYYDIDEETRDINSYSEGKNTQARMRDVNRKNDLAQLQTAIITSQSDRGAWPGTKYNLGNEGFSGAEKGAKISDISKELYNVGMSSIPKDPNTNSLVYGLGAEYRTEQLTESNGAFGDYLYLVSTRNSIRWGGFVLMAKTETEEGSNWVVCKDEQGLDKGYIKRGTDLKDITICYKIIKGDTCSSNADTCTYTDEEELRYILLY